MTSEVENFVVKFFQSLGAEVIEQGEIVEVNKIPVLVSGGLGIGEKVMFTSSPEKAKEGVILISKASRLVKAIQEYISSQGAMSLLKMQVPFDYKKFASDNLKMNGCEVVGVSCRNLFENIIKFNFVTAYQYLNESEVLKTEVLIGKEGVIDKKLPDYQLIDGRKDESELPEIKKEYELAKNKVREIIKEYTNKVSATVQNKLTKEINRIDKHYAQLTKEDEQGYERAKKIVGELNEKAKKEDVSERMNRAKEQLSKAEEHKAINSQKSNGEREALINQEKRKHALSISTKLAHTSIIYYPVFDVVLSLRSNEVRRAVSLKFNPVENKTELPVCESCGKGSSSLFLCNSAHISCENCLRACIDCRQKTCVKCLKNECAYCGRKPCAKCVQRCRSCFKYLCQNHSLVDSINGGVRCKECSHQCPSCGKASDKKDFAKCAKCGKECCKACVRRVFAERNIQTLCFKCAK